METHNSPLNTDIAAARTGNTTGAPNRLAIRGKPRPERIFEPQVHN